MIQEFLDKIVVVVAFFLTSESARQLVHFRDLNETDDAITPSEEEQHSVLVDHHHDQCSTTFEQKTEAPPTTENREEEERNTETVYGTVPNIALSERTLLHSCKTSLCVSFTIIAAVIPVSLLMISVLYMDVNTSNICYQQLMNNNNRSLPQKRMRYVIIGHDIEGIALNLWFQLSLILLFGWERFKLHHSATLLLGFVLGLVVVIFKTTLFLVEINFTETKYRYPGNVVFFFGVVYSSYMVAKKVCATFSSRTIRLKKRHVFAIISTQFFLGGLVAMAYRYAFVPWYRNTKNGTDQAIIAMSTTTLFLLPVIISENLAVKSFLFVNAGRSFVLVYFVNGVSILLYCIMQAGVNDLDIFIALSVFRGVFQVFQTATVKIRQRIFIGIWKCLVRKCTSCPPVGEFEESRDHRRLKVDKEVQVMLYQSIAIIISQAYLVLYLTSNYHVETQDILREFILKRAFIGIGISFVANYLSILIHIHRHKAQLEKVWRSHWKLHVIAVSLVGVLSICYFTPVLLSVFKTFASTKKYQIKDCSLLFQ
jgi:hypothetical protein